MSAGPRRSETLSDSLGEYSGGLETPPPPPSRGGSPLFNFSFDLQEFPQLQSEKSLLDFTQQSVQQLCDHVCMTLHALCIEGSDGSCTSRLVKPRYS